MTYNEPINQGLTNASSQSNQIMKYNYGNYCQWPDEERWELIDGVPYALTTPSRLHQGVVFELAGQIGNSLRDSDSHCEGYLAPFDVRLPKGDEADDQVDTVVQPDLLVVCDQAKLDEKGCRGAPDWIVEVTSPSTVLRDLGLKRDVYEKHGVQEYWIVHPSERWVMVYLLDEAGSYGKPDMFGMDEVTVVKRVSSMSINWAFLAE